MRVFFVTLCLFLIHSFSFANKDEVSAGVQSEDGLLKVEVSGLRTSYGKVYCYLYKRADVFPNRPDLAVESKVKIVGSKATCSFSGVAPGRYAVSMYHDENGNGKIDRGFLGIPKEGYGFSNNAPSKTGPASFSDAAFSYSGQELLIKIKTTYR